MKPVLNLEELVDGFTLSLSVSACADCHMLSQVFMNCKYCEN